MEDMSLSKKELKEMNLQQLRDTLKYQEELYPRVKELADIDEEIREFILEEQPSQEDIKFGRIRDKEMKVKVPIERFTSWRTQEGESIPIEDMADSHLLNCIHMMERNRLRQLEEVTRKYSEINFEDKETWPSIYKYYNEFPLAYHAMVEEGCKRGIVGRNRELQQKLDNANERINNLVLNYDSCYQQWRKATDEIIELQIKHYRSSQAFNG